MRRLRRILEPRGDDGSCFVVYDGIGELLHVTGCWLEVYYVFENENELWAYEAKYGTGPTVQNGLRLTLLRNRPEGPQVRVAIRPQDADAYYHTSDVGTVTRLIDADIRQHLG